LLAAVVALVAILTIRELLDLSTHYGIEPLRGPTYAMSLLMLAVTGFSSAHARLREVSVMLSLGLIVVFGAFLLAAIAMRRTDLRTAFPGAAVSAFAIQYIAAPLAMLVAIRDLWIAAVPGAVWILYLLAIVWSGDTFALYVGKSIGRHKMAPRISPGKTWEGAAASFIGSVAVGTFVYAKAFSISNGLGHLGLIMPEQVYRNLNAPLLHLGTIVVLSGFINIAAQLGDLIESLIKRGAGVKDSGALLPGHGGMLDRIDALLFAAPVLWVFVVLNALYSVSD
jgi:phosphatidate cytidylyltransferase